MRPAERLRTLARTARSALRRPVSVHGVEVLQISLSGDPDGRWPEPEAPPGVSARLFEDLEDPALREALPPDRRGLLPERARRGDVYLVGYVDEQPAGWLTLARASHRDPWSGLRIGLAADEIYCYDLWIDAQYRRSGAARYLALWTLRHAASDPALNHFYCWVDQDNVPSQKLIRDVLGFTLLQRVSYARLLDRLGVPVPFSDRPRYGPFSRRGRHRS